MAILITDKTKATPEQLKQLREIKVRNKYDPDTIVRGPIEFLTIQQRLKEENYEPKTEKEIDIIIEKLEEKRKTKDRKDFAMHRKAILKL